MSAKKKSERTKPSRSDAPTCSPEFVALLREAVACFDSFRIMAKLPGLSSLERKVWIGCAEAVQESVETVVPDWDAILKSAHDEEND